MTRQQRQRRVRGWRGRWARTQFVVVAVILAVAAPTVLADEITLKGSVRVPAGVTEIRLGDIADLSGSEAKACSDTVIAPLLDRTAALELSVNDVRAALTAAGVHWGKVHLNGGTVIVRPTGPAGAGPPMFMTAASIDQTPREIRRTVMRSGYESAEALVDLMTLRGAIARTIVGGLRLPPSRVRLTFDQRDAPILDTDLETQRFEIQPLSNLDSDRVELRVRAWSQGRIVHRQTMTVHPTIRTNVVVLRTDIHRGDVLHEEICSIESRWLTPIQAGTMCSLVEAVGRVAGTSVKAGEPLKTKHVKRELLIKRGDRVMVRCLVGGVVISMEAEAKSNGAEGEQIELRKLGERDTFFGTVAGPGSALIDLSRS